MSGYTLRVFYSGKATPTATATADRGSEVLDKIQSLLTQYPDCHRIIVATHTMHLFAVDQNGQTVTD